MAQDPLHLLCIEPRFPGRLGAVADWLVRRRGYRCWFYCASNDPQPFWPPSVGRGLDLVPFQLGGVAKENAVPWTRHMERGLCYAYGCWEVLTARRPRPIEVVLGRSSTLGSSLFAPINYPNAPIVNFFDGWVRAKEGDVAAEINPETAGQYHLWRASSPVMDLLDMENGAVPWTATQWQRQTYPRMYRDEFQVLHDGVDMRLYKPRAEGPRMIAGRVVPHETKVVTFISRSLDRVRGFDRFYKLANRLAKEDPNTLFVMVGTPQVHRGVDIDYYGRNYVEHLVSESPMHDPSRFWYLGVVPRTTIAEVLAASDLHVAPTRVCAFPRSIAEAMSSGIPLLASDDPPQREFLEHGKNGLLVDAADSEALFNQAWRVLRNRAEFEPLVQAALETASERFDYDVTMPQIAGLLQGLVENKQN